MEGLALECRKQNKAKLLRSLALAHYQIRIVRPDCSPPPLPPKSISHITLGRALLFPSPLSPLRFLH